ncbi:MAG: hypothetical protein V1723_03955 [Candidatus Uhrbacteria bacterium]
MFVERKAFFGERRYVIGRIEAMRRITWAIIGSIALLAIVGGIVLGASSRPADVGVEQLAKALTEHGARMYGAWWCGHCQSQKALFGDAWRYITYVECAVPGNVQGKTAECDAAGITGYPTWVFPDGSRLFGEISLEQLAERIGFSYPVAIK